MAKVGGNKVPEITGAEHISPEHTGDNISAKRVANYIWNGTSWERMGVDSNTISRYDYSNSSEIYVGTAPKGTASATADWEITKYNLTDGSDASGLKASDVTWTGRTGHTYS